MATSFDDFLDELDKNQEEEMRSFWSLSPWKKVKRVWFDIGRFFRYRVWGTHHGTGIVRFWYWLECHLRPSMRFHIIDLRKHAGEIYRSVGWIDRDHAMWLACFHLLCEFVEKEDPNVGRATLESYMPSWHTMETWPANERALAENQLADEVEIRALYDWWKVGRARDHKELDSCRVERFRDMKHGNPEWDRYMALADQLELKDEEMFNRLMKVRNRLWT